MMGRKMKFDTIPNFFFISSLILRSLLYSRKVDLFAVKHNMIQTFVGAVKRGIEFSFHLWEGQGGHCGKAGVSAGL